MNDAREGVPMLVMIIVSLVVMVLDGERGGRWISAN